MNYGKVLKWICFALFLLKSPSPTSSHSYLLYPRGDFSSFNQAHCRVGGPVHAPTDFCPGPCINESSWQFDRNAPIYELRRNQTLTVIWPRNNHRGGFVRFSMVPKSLRMSREAHEEYAFRYSCFEADIFPCNGDHCGTDVWVYRTDILIPCTFGDGDYILSWAWFGGLTQSDSFFGDYYSCSNVKIRNGPTALNSDRTFNPGNNTMYPAACRSSVDQLGICDREPCLGLKEKEMIPQPFSSGSPAPLTYRPTAPSAEFEDNGNSSTLRLTGLRLLNAETKAVVSEVSARTIHVPEDMEKHMTFEALVEGDVVSVSFYINQEYTRTEKQAPYMAFGDTDDRILSWEEPILGEEFELKVVAKDKHGSLDEGIFLIEIALS